MLYVIPVVLKIRVVNSMKLPIFPPKTLSKMKNLGISESQIIDVFNNGQYTVDDSGSKMAIKKVAGCEIGCLYDQNIRTGAYTITAVWKREI